MSTVISVHDQLSDLLDVAEERSLREIQTRVRGPLVRYSLSAILDGMAFLSENRDHRTRENNVIYRSGVATMELLFREFDAAGLDRFVQQVAPKFAGVDFVELGPLLEHEVSIAQSASIFPEEYHSWLVVVNEGKAELIDRCRAGTFHCSDIGLSSAPGYLGPGASWKGLSGFLSGAILVANIVGEVPTGGLATASIIAGAAGGLYSVAGR
jgi:hypothetical protein